MASLVQQQAPEFKGMAVLGDNSFKEISLADYKGKYVVLFFYPLDFTFVCPSEILAFDKKYNEFKERGAELLGVSVDSHFTHLAYKNTAVDKGGIGKIQYPLIADISKNIARNYGVLDMWMRPFAFSMRFSTQKNTEKFVLRTGKKGTRP